VELSGGLDGCLMYKMDSNGRISVISSNGSSTNSELFQQDFSGKELLLLLRLQSDPELFESWKANVINGDSDEYYSLAVSLATANDIKAYTYITLLHILWVWVKCGPVGLRV